MTTGSFPLRMFGWLLCVALAGTVAGTCTPTKQMGCYDDHNRVLPAYVSSCVLELSTGTVF